MKLAKTIDYLKENQNQDGGFGLETKSLSDPLSTSFSILTLKQINAKENKEFIKKAEEYLKNSQRENEAWKTVNFIKPKIQEPYGSETITTAFVLKALSS